MEVGGGDAAEQVVRMMLSGGEVAVRLSGSALKNGLALLLALARNHKKVYGKVSMTKMLRETRDIRLFPMTMEQYRDFKKDAKPFGILYAGIKDTRNGNDLIDVVLPATEVDRANTIFERILYTQAEKTPEQERPPEKAKEPEKTPKKESRSGRDSQDTRDSSSTARNAETTRTTHEKPSVEQKLKGYREQQAKQAKSAPARAKTKKRAKTK